MMMQAEDLVWVENSKFWPILKYNHQVESAKELFQFGGLFPQILNREFTSTIALKEELLENIDSIEEFDFVVALVDYLYQKN